MKPICPFTTDETPQVTQVGGKAMSLILMTQKGLPVPPGFVLTVAFFEPWLAQIQGTPEWANVVSSSPEDLKRTCDRVQRLAMALELDGSRRTALAEALAALQDGHETHLFAVAIRGADSTDGRWRLAVPPRLIGRSPRKLENTIEDRDDLLARKRLDHVVEDPLLSVRQLRWVVFRRDNDDFLGRNTERAPGRKTKIGSCR